MAAVFDQWSPRPARYAAPATGPKWIAATSSGPGAVVLAPSHPDNVLGGDRLRYAAFDVGPRVNDTTNRFVRLLDEPLTPAAVADELRAG